MDNNIQNPPLVQGGQGRSSEELSDCAYALVFWFVVAVTTVGVLWTI